MTRLCKTTLPLFALLIALAVVVTAGAATYTVGGYSLGERIARDNAGFRSFKCEPSDVFEGYTWCERSQRMTAAQGNGTRKNVIIHGDDRAPVYLMENVAPVAIDRNAIEAEIENLSKRMNELPLKVEWLSRLPGLPTSVIVSWGKVELEPLSKDDMETVAAGNNLTRGLLVDTLGDPTRSATAGLPVYRIAGGAGYLYSASFDGSGRGHQNYVAVDVSQPSLKLFLPKIREAIRKDQAKGSNDYGLWGDIALAVRNVSLDASADIANEALDKAFSQYKSKKLRSRVWSLLPMGSTGRLAGYSYYSDDIYGPKTGFPKVRADIKDFLAKNPSEPFNEFLFYTIGDIDKALEANPNSVIIDVLRYGKGHQLLKDLLQETANHVQLPKLEDSQEPVNDALAFLNQHPELSDNKPLSAVVPSFAERAAAARPYFEAVVQHSSAPLSDDAAYMLAWLDYHQGRFTASLAELSQAMSLGNRDYEEPAVKQAVRILRRYAAREQLAMVDGNTVLAKEPTLWYLAARAAYREFDYPAAVEIGERGLRRMNVSIDRLPVTTDQAKIDAALKRILPKDSGLDINLREIPYVMEASREIQQYLAFLKSPAAQIPDNLNKRARAIIMKYSRLVEQPDSSAGKAPQIVSHRDLRQALHLIEMTSQSAGQNPQNSALREWMMYRKVRILVQFAPEQVPDAVVALEKDFPNSKLLDDALAEEIFAEGVARKDVAGAEKTFRRLVEKYPNGNAVDNAYTWMAIIYRCAGRPDDALKLNRDILRLFPTTRHARYATTRMAEPDAKSCRAWQTAADQDGTK